MVAETVAKRQLRGIGLTAIGRPRPSFLTDELFNAVCEEVAKGSNVKRCAREMGFSEASWRYALANESQLAALFALAKQEQANAMEDELAEIADDKSGDVITKTLKDGSTVEVADSEFIARSKVRIDTRKWLMSKINPKKYGERLEVDQTVTHEAGDSIMQLMAGIRAERAVEAIEIEQPSIGAPDTVANLTPEVSTDEAW